MALETDKRSPPLLVVCLDATDRTVVRRLMHDGRMPALAGIRARGIEAEIDTVADVLEHCVWPPLVSGRPVGDYAVPFFYVFDPTTMGLEFRREADADLEPFWAHLPERGRGAVALDMPDLHPSPTSQADESCCWHEHAPPHAPFFTSKELRRRLEAFGTPPRLDDPDYGADASAELDERLAGAYAASARFRGRVAADLCRGRQVACIAFHEAHVAHHSLGHHWTDRHWYRPSSGRRPELFERTYEAIDAAIADVTDAFGDGNVVVVMSSGLRPGTRSGHLLEGLLTRAGLLTLADAPDGGATSGSTADADGDSEGGVLSRVRRTLNQIIPEGVHHRIASRRFDRRHDWTRTRAFSLPNWNTGYIRANVLGRERDGIVPPEELDELLDHTAQLVLETRDADTGGPLAGEVIRAHHRFPGTRDQRLPDLIVTWAVDRPARRASHPTLGEWSADIGPGHLWTNHAAGGLVLAAGPGIRTLPDGLALDPLGFAPTMLALQGVAAPGIMREPAWNDVLA